MARGFRKWMSKRLEGQTEKNTFDKERDVAFLHIGKTAGSQIKDLANNLNSLQDRFRIVGQKHRTRLSDLPEDLRYFFSIRDPVTRFRSAFYSRKRRGRPRYDNPWSRTEELAFAKFEQANDLAEALSAADDRDKSAFWAMSTIGHVCTQQVDWFHRAGLIFEHRPPVHVVRQEHFRKDFAVLLQRLGSSIRLEDLTVVEASPTAHVFDYSTTPPLSDLAKRNIETWYRRDVEFYRFCCDWIETRSL